jgi:CRP/FNR family transcriptional regulator, cyclic AMP receptor protein
VNRLTIDDMRFLRSRGWLSLCEAAFAEALLGKCRVHVLEAGDTLFHPGDPSTGLYGILSGSVGVSIVVPEFGPTLAHLMLPGAWFGETALVRRVRASGVRATRATRVVFIAMRDTEALVAQDARRWPALALIAVLNGQLAMGAAYDLMLRDPQQRCAATLLRLGGFRHGVPRPMSPVQLDITQSDLAQMTNLSRNSVGAILRVLKTRDCIDVDYGQLLITNPEKLAQVLTPEG